LLRYLLLTAGGAWRFSGATGFIRFAKFYYPEPRGFVRFCRGSAFIHAAFQIARYRARVFGWCTLL